MGGRWDEDGRKMGGRWDGVEDGRKMGGRWMKMGWYSKMVLLGEQ